MEELNDGGVERVGWVLGLDCSGGLEGTFFRMGVLAYCCLSGV